MIFGANRQILINVVQNTVTVTTRYDNLIRN